MHRVLTIPELLDTIFRSLNGKHNLANALVCHSWSEIALDTLWRQVDDIYRLFSLLAPLRESAPRCYEFSRLPESSDWKKFEKYSKRVRELQYDETKSHVVLGQTVFDDIARTRTSLAILPNMNTLIWRAPIPLCVMFMHSNVRRFAIHLPDIIATTSPRPFFDDIIARMPRLTHLDIRTNIAVRALGKELPQLLSWLPNLQKVTTPRFFFTSSIAECLSRLPKLGCVEFQYYPEQGTGDSADVSAFRPELTEGAFPCLWDLSLTAAYSDLDRFLTIPFAPSNLTMLYVESPNLESPPTVHQLLTIISENCQMLKLLALISPRWPSENGGTDVSGRVDINTLKPLFGCANLTSFEMIHQYPLNLSQADLEVLALRWPSLETINLNTEPHQFELPSLTLEALLPFARHCPRLISLGLFINASPDVIPELSATMDPPSFKRLGRLAMGLSAVGEPTEVAVFLSHILPFDCQIDSGIVWDECFDLDPQAATSVAQRFDAWAAVGSLLPTLTRVRMEEREKMKDLKRELSDLKIRTQLLSDKFENMVQSADSCVTL